MDDRGRTGPDAGTRAPRGTAGFLSLIARLVRRPRRGERRLPIIWLGGPEAPAVLDALDRRLRVPRGKVVIPHPNDSADVRLLLTELRGSLARHDAGTGRLRFPHSALLEWLMRQDVRQLDDDARLAGLAKELRQRRRPGNAENRLDPGVVSQPGTVLHLLWWLVLQVVPAVVFRAVVSGRVPGVGRPYRWFMAQPFLEPEQSGTFLRFAERLTTGIRDREDSEQIGRLLVHAFLEDMRRAFARPPWRIRRRRRTAYPVAMIEAIAPGNAGHDLLRLIHQVRNETGLPDPLLVVCAGESAPPREIAAGPEADGAVTLEDIASVHGRTAGYVPLGTVPSANAEPVDDLPRIVAPRPPWFARPAGIATVCLALLASGLGWSGWWLGAPQCLHMPFAGQVSVRSVDGQCIGYSDDPSFTFNDQAGQEKLRRIQDKIFAQNQEVQDIWERGQRRRPYVTLVYLGSLTGRSTKKDEEAYAAEREELEGLAVAQFQGIQGSAGAYSLPLMRIVVANAGFQMKHADTAVDMIADLAHQGGDAPVVGVVGLVESRKSTEQALRKLNRAGLPIVAPTLSADGMDKNSKLYLQIAPPNKDQAHMVAEYARTVLGVSGARVYYTVGEHSTRQEDRYVDTLLRDVRDELGSDLEYTEYFRDGDSLGRECGYSGMLFFAGRWSEFDHFVQALDNSCGDNRPRHLVADDSVNRYMANPSLRRNAPGNLPLDYVSKAALATCDALHARADGGTDEAADRFLRSVRQRGLLTPPRCLGTHRPQEWVGERVGLAYDSAMLLMRAVQTLVARVREPDQQWEPDKVNPAAIHTEVLHRNLVTPFSGVTGTVTFTPEGGEPLHKRISILRVTNIARPRTPPTEVFHCGIARAADSPTCEQPSR